MNQLRKLLLLATGALVFTCKPLKSGETGSRVQGVILNDAVTAYAEINDRLGTCLADMLKNSVSLLNPEAMILQHLAVKQFHCIDMTVDAMAVDDASAVGQSLITKVNRCAEDSRSYLDRCLALAGTMPADLVENGFEEPPQQGASSLPSGSKTQRAALSLDGMCAAEKIASCVGTPNRTVNGIGDGLTRSLDWVLGQGCDTKPAIAKYNRYPGAALLRMLAVQKGILTIKKSILSNPPSPAGTVGHIAAPLFDERERNCRYAEQTDFDSQGRMFQDLEEAFSRSKALAAGSPAAYWQDDTVAKIDEQLANNRKAFAAICGNFEYDNSWQKVTSWVIIDLVANYSWINEVFSISDEVPRMAFNYFNSREPGASSQAGKVTSGYTGLDDFTEGYCFQKAIATNTRDTVSGARIWEIWKFDSAEIWSQLADLIPLAGSLVSIFIDEQLDLSVLMVHKIKANVSKLLWMGTPETVGQLRQAFYQDVVEAERSLRERESERFMRRGITYTIAAIALIPGKKAILRAGTAGAKRFAVSYMTDHPALMKRLVAATAASRETLDFTKVMFKSAFSAIPGISSAVDAAGPALAFAAMPIRNFLKTLQSVHVSKRTALPPSMIDMLSFESHSTQDAVEELFGQLNAKHCVSREDDCLAPVSELMQDVRNWLSTKIRDGTDPCEVNDIVEQCFIR